MEISEDMDHPRPIQILTSPEDVLFQSTFSIARHNTIPNNRTTHLRMALVASNETAHITLLLTFNYSQRNTECTFPTEE